MKGFETMNNENENSKMDAELLEEIRQWQEKEKATEDTPDEYRFTNPDPYAKPEPLPEERRNRNFWFGEDGHIHVKNLSAFWLPELTMQREIGGTVYSVTGSYDGTETLDKKLERILEQNAENGEDIE